MKPIFSIVKKAIKIGPLPYLALAVIILSAGVFLQIRSLTPENVGGRSIFGIMAQIGGAVGLFGLVTLAFGGGSATHYSTSIPSDVPQSAIDARMADASSQDNPARPIPTRPVAGASKPRAASKRPALKSSAASKMGLRMARQMGTRMLSQALRR